MHTKKLFLTLFVLLFTSQISNSQVTIGSLDTPAEGALLDISGGANNSKGLALPRVSLASNSSLDPCVDPNEVNYANEKKLHIGLVVFNTTEIDGSSNYSMKKKDMLCKGLHVWTGEKWQALIPYFDPDITRSGPKEKLIITRGPGDSEVTEYTTAYFHGYSRKTTSGTPTTGSVYVCDRSKLMEIDAGQWMTMNLRTKYMTGDEKLEPRVINGQGQDDQIIPRFDVPNYPAESSGLYPLPLTDQEKELNGYLYNWAAATNRKDTEKNIKEAEYPEDHARVQGICPDGWHLPAINEWRELLFILRAQSNLFGTLETTSAANLISPFSGGKSLSPEQGSMDFRMLGTVHNTANSGKLTTIFDPYMKSAFYWSSTSGELDEDGGHNGDWRKWNARGLNVRLTTTSISIPTGGTHRSRVLTESIRCKKN